MILHAKQTLPKTLSAENICRCSCMLSTVDVDVCAALCKWVWASAPGRPSQRKAGSALGCGVLLLLCAALCDWMWSHLWLTPLVSATRKYKWAPAMRQSPIADWFEVLLSLRLLLLCTFFVSGCIYRWLLYHDGPCLLMPCGAMSRHACGIPACVDKRV
jgi:hypothetical protein